MLGYGCPRAVQGQGAPSPAQTSKLHLGELQGTSTPGWGTGDAFLGEQPHRPHWSPHRAAEGCATRFGLQVEACGPQREGPAPTCLQRRSSSSSLAQVCRKFCLSDSFINGSEDRSCKSPPGPQGST